MLVAAKFVVAPAVVKVEFAISVPGCTEEAGVPEEASMIDKVWEVIGNTIDEGDLVVVGAVGGLESLDVEGD